MNAPKNPPIQIDPIQIPSDKRFNETQNDEISLFEIVDYMVRIVDFMIRKRSIILSVAIIFTLLAAGYALSITPKYKTTISFLMPQETLPVESFSTKSTAEFQKIIKETKTSLYQNFLMKIQSFNFQQEVLESGNFLKKFVDNSDGSVNSDAVVLEINKSISLTGVPAKNTELFNKPVFLEMEGSKPEAMAEFINALVKTGIKTIRIEDHLLNTIDQQLKKISSKKAILLSQEKIKQLQQKKNQEQQISQKKKKIENEIALLKKDLALARSMNIEENNFKYDQPLNKAPRWYLFGAKILEAELNLLQSQAKKSDVIESAKSIDVIEEAKPIDNTQIKNLDMEFKTWESFKTLKHSNFVIINQPSIPPTQPFQNKRNVIIFTGLLAGLFFGSTIAFFQHARRTLNAKRNLVSEVNNKTKSFIFKRSSQTAS